MSGEIQSIEETEPQKIKVTIENRSEQAKEQLWSEFKDSVIEKLKEHGVSYNANLIQNKEQLDNAGQILIDIENKEKQQSEADKETSREGVRGGDTAWLLPEKEKTIMQLDSETDITALEFEDEHQLIEALNTLNKKQNPQAKQILGTLAKKAFKNKNQEFVFEGRTKDMLRADLPITPNLPNEEQKIRTLYNENLRKNRCAWVEES